MNSPGTSAPPSAPRRSTELLDRAAAIATIAGGLPLLQTVAAFFTGAVAVWAVLSIGAITIVALLCLLSRTWRRRRGRSFAALVLLLVVVSGLVGAAASRLSIGSAGLDSPLLPSPLSGPTSTRAWEKRWAGAIEVKFAQIDIDFDSLPPPGRYGFGTDLNTDRQGAGLYSQGDGKLVAWTDQDEPTPQQCNDLLVKAPAGQESQYIQNPEAGRYYCLLTWNGQGPGRVVQFKVVQAITGGYSLEATVWNP